MGVKSLLKILPLPKSVTLIVWDNISVPPEVVPIFKVTELSDSVESNTLSVSVKARSCLVADAWATALMILPFDDGLTAVTEAGGLEALWIFSEGKEDLSRFSTKDFYSK